MKPVHLMKQLGMRLRFVLFVSFSSLIEETDRESISHLSVGIFCVFSAKLRLLLLFALAALTEASITFPNPFFS